MEGTEIFLIFVISYFLGAIPNGHLISKFIYNFDVESYGSGNIGATNILANLGIVPALLTLIIDASFGFLAVCIAKALNHSIYISAVAGILCVAGHIFPIFRKGFNGGKGVATSFGVGLAVVPLDTMLCFLVFIFVLLITRYVAIGSIVGSSFSPFFAFILYKDPIFLLILLLFPILIVISHRRNIKNIIEGKEIMANRSYLRLFKLDFKNKKRGT
ncbi:glycerol-3-phosphate 1-O-acyltransferase PlsY [Caldisericum exile]|uniref:Glycerol-3-phosphate acyltransferase n=1 Tax=Caldisericum exile (strain DSM 21853 / NBRC 104410 / AZM16c01) TaxID=511051 RepID=A0A7U6JF91_CALEA|nr:glycerol-3-phosphate 1-O-acyltransferase PlsY [Caldisericum exile]BAL81228.1 acyl-phosphate--glycerol-phosphate acyltransferase [Caldisericum exile AZM16c01]